MCQYARQTNPCIDFLIFHFAVNVVHRDKFHAFAFQNGFRHADREVDRSAFVTEREVIFLAGLKIGKTFGKFLINPFELSDVSKYGQSEQSERLAVLLEYESFLVDDDDPCVD